MMESRNNGNDDAAVDPAVLLPLLLGLSRSSGCSSSSAALAHAASTSHGEGGARNDEQEAAKDGKVELAENPFLVLEDDIIATLSFPAKLHRLLSVTTAQPTTTTMPSSSSFSQEARTVMTTTSLSSKNNNSDIQSYYSHILSWTDHGRSFRIHDPLALEQILLPRYFALGEDGKDQDDDDSNKDASFDANDGGGKRMKLFQRELMKWGFRTCHGTTTTATSTEKSSLSSTTTTTTATLEYYHPDFLRCHYDKVHNMCYNHHDSSGGGQFLTGKGGGGGGMNSDEMRERDGKSEEKDVVMKDVSPGRDNDPEVEQGGGEGEEVSNPDRHLEEKEDVVAQITNFMAVTGSDSAIVARQYLEMSGNHLETAISLFLDHGGASGTSAGAGAGASGEVTAMTRVDRGTSGGGEDNMMDDEEPNFYASPPMPPLSSSLNQATTTKKKVMFPAERIVESALREYCAFRTIRRALLTHWIRQRFPRPQQSAEEGRARQLVGVVPTGVPQDALAAPKEKLNTLPRGPASHFLFQSLLHPSLPVRRTAARMILHNFHLILQRDRCKMKKKDAPLMSRGDLQEVLVILLHGLMFGEAPYYQQHQRTMFEVDVQPHQPQQQQQQPRWSALPMIPCFKNQSDGGDPAFQIMGLLVSLVCEGGFSSILVCNEVMDLFQQQGGGLPSLSGACDTSQGRCGDSSEYLDMSNSIKKEDIIASSLLRELSSGSIESFVAGGGLRWACGSILRLVHMLVYGSAQSIIAVGGTRYSHVATNTSGGNCSDVSHGDGRSRSRLVDPMDDITSCTIQNRLLLLIDLVYRLVLFGSVPSAVDRRSLVLRGEDDSIKAGERVYSSKGSTKGNDSDMNDSTPGASTYSQVLQSRARELNDLIQRSDGSSSAVQDVATGSGIGSLADTDRTAQTSYLQRLESRSSGGVPSIMAGSSHSRSSGSMRSFIHSSDNAVKGGAPSSGVGGRSRGRIGQHGPTASVLDENCRRKESRRSILERVHKVFWSSELPAAICVPPDRTTSIVAPRVDSDGSESTAAAAVESSLAGHLPLSPLACLVAAHEILRSRPMSHATLSINQRLRALEKGIAILGRIVDPVASTPVVIVSNDVPWELAQELPGDNSKKSVICDGDHGVNEGYTARRYGAITHPRSSRNHNRYSSHDAHRSRNSSAPTELFDSTTTRLPPSRLTSGGVVNELHGARGTGSSPSIVGHRTKRFRSASSNVTSILERLPRVESPTGNGGGDVGGSGVSASLKSNSARSGLAAAQVENVLEATSLPIGGAGSGEQSSNSAARYRTATESMRRLAALSTDNAASVASAAVSSRDGTLSRLLALGGRSSRGEPFGSSGIRSNSNTRTDSSNSVSTTASPALSIASRALMRERAMAAAELEEWRVLQDLPEGGDLMDIDDDAYLSNVDDDEEDCGNIDEEESASEEGGNSDADEDEDSDAESLFEVNHPDHSIKLDPDEDNIVDGGCDESEGEDEEDAVARSKIYDEETDDDASQFDNAVINLEDVNLTTSSGPTRCELSHQGHHPICNPHRQSLSRIPASSELESGASSLNEIRGNSCSSKCNSPISAALMKREREQAYVRAAMSILSAQHLGFPTDTMRGCGTLLIETTLLANPCTTVGTPLLTRDSEQSLLKSLCHIVKPPRKPLNLKIFLRRTPTQEEYFRGSLSRNPIGLSSLRAACAATGSSGGSGGADSNDRRISSGRVVQSGSNDEPLVSDLRMYIAKDLQMEDSSELLELLVANKILDMNLKLRVVQQVLWRRYVEENATSASSLGVTGAGPSHQMISTGNGLSMIFSSSGLVAARNRIMSGGRETVVGSDEKSIMESFPPMVVTYRLAGVDGEATEDKVELDDLEDPEAPSKANLSPAETERRMEKEFGITRLILAQRNGVALLLENIECTISHCLRRIRRDEVARRHLLRSSSGIGNEAVKLNDYRNGARERFARAQPCPGLILLRLSANISDNRKLMLANRAPTLLLRILLDILNAMNKSSESLGSDKVGRVRSSTFDSSAHSIEVETTAAVVGVSATNIVHHVDGNPTADALQEIIEMLASDISSEISDGSKPLASKAGNGSSSSFVSLIQAENNQQTGAGEYQDERTLPLVLRSLHSTALSPPLQKVIAKLLPFLTYGRLSQSKELASYFCKYINIDRLGTVDGPHCSEQEQHQQENALMTTFLEAAINLPPVPICDNLRNELLSNGFVGSVQSFLIEGAPSQPPSWSPALYCVSSKKLSEIESSDLIERWRNYLNRPGLNKAFKILTGLCSRHVATQLYLSGVSCVGGAKEASPCKDFNFLMLCHWIESTSDNSASNILNPCGILAETLLDALKEDNETSSAKIDALRRKTRETKRKLADERRDKALGGIRAFGACSEQQILSAASGYSSTAGEISADNRSMFAAMFSSLLSPSSLSATQRMRAPVSNETQDHKALPSWMAEVEALADEAGITCAVCQEGRSLQPTELLGLYAYIKKVTITSSQGGGRGDVDGTVLLLSLPASFPSSLANTSDMEVLFTRSRLAANALEGTSHALSAMASSTGTGVGSGSSRINYYVTTVSAGNAIHCSCHNKAKAADRNHPKAPKSEWDGANLRNSRVACNVILPLVSSMASKVPLIAVEKAMVEYNTIVTNTLGARPKSILWNCLHDIRFLLLRMAYGEALGADCGGGSSSSNFLLLLYQLYSADLLAKNSEHDESLEILRHARGLSSGFLVAMNIIDDPNFDRTDPRLRRLERGIAFAAPMAALLSILFFNSGDVDASNTSCSETIKAPSPTRQWEVYKSKFLSGLVRCAGLRHSLGVTDSGCVTSRGISTGRKNIEKARSFVDWSNDDDVSSRRTTSSIESQRVNMIDDYSRALRPMITLYVIFDQLSKEFIVDNDERTLELSERLATKLELCHKANSIHDLFRLAEIYVEDTTICKIFEKGATS